jgi:MFS transporter, ACS family, D-galactonate transporter
VAKAETRLTGLPASDAAFLAANAVTVVRARRDNPGQWQTWWWICFAAQLVFVSFVFLLTGHWSPRKAHEAAREHERIVERELSRIAGDIR